MSLVYPPGEFATLSDVLEWMEAQLREWEAAEDTRRVFLRAYLHFTRETQRAVRIAPFEDDALEDAEWVDALGINLAQHYLDAVEGYERDGDVPECWELAFDVGAKRPSAVLVPLIVSMKAHILRDLPMALAETDFSRDRDARFRDYRRVDALLNEMVDGIQRDVSRRYARRFSIFDRLAGRRDEILTRLGIEASRADAWIMAVALADGQDEATREATLDAIERKAATTARMLLAGGGPLATTRAGKGARAARSRARKAMRRRARSGASS